MEKSPQKDKKHRSLFKHDSKPVEQKPDCSKQARKKRVSDKTVVTGGAGYFGFTLGRALAKSGTEVILYDRKTPLWEIPKGVELVQLHKKEIQSVNIEGTGVVLEVCKQRNIPRLIYTSSVNVVFAGQTIIDGDEASLTYFPIDQQVNEYSRTKSIAEQMILAANGSPLAGGGKLYTCALRPPGIYGPEEQRHLPRLALNIERGLFAVRFGDPGALMNWVHVKNLVQAHILAAEALTLEKNYIAGGQAYFIHDNEKVNLFEWLSPLFEGLGVRKPWIRIPVFLVRISAIFMENLHYVLCPIVEITPPITRHEVLNVSCMHTFKINKARAHLGYSPKKYTFTDCVDHYLKQNPKKRNFFLLKCFLWTVFLIGLVIVLINFPEIVKFLWEIWETYVGILQ